jgi:hypothetical protein
MPVQRLPRVMLLLADLLKKTDKDHRDYANIEKCLAKVKDTMDIVNETIRFNEKELEFWDSEPVLKPFIAPQRKPIRKGQLKVRTSALTQFPPTATAQV